MFLIVGAVAIIAAAFGLDYLSARRQQQRLNAGLPLKAEPTQLRLRGTTASSVNVSHATLNVAAAKAMVTQAPAAQRD